MTTLADLSAATQARFVAALEGVYEHSSWVAERAWATRPFATLADLHAALARAVAAAPQAERLALVRAHPELAGRAALRGELTALSRGEQRGAGLDQCSPDELAELTRLNGAYRERFGFPFVIAVRGHTPASVIAVLARRLANSPEAELEEALRQIDRIALIRLRDRFAET